MLLTNIARLVTNDGGLGATPLGVVEDAALVLSDGKVAWAGPAGAVPEGAGDERIDAGGRCVLPGFVDAHTHLVFAGDRAAEFSARLQGERYDGGGILTTVAATREASREELAAATARLAGEALRSGTTTMEVKSGYGLTVADERRLLDVVAQVRGPDLPDLVTTFLGAHVVPAEYAGRADDYVDLVCGPMVESCAPAAQWCDVFCEETVFDADRARRVLSAGRAAGLGLRLHANQLRPGPGAQLAAELAVTSADHLTHLDDDDITALADAGVVATLLPAAEFSTGSPYAPARRLVDAGVRVALATDCNPGTSYTTSMPFVIALACREMGLTPSEAVTAATAGGAASLRRGDIGHLGVGATADLVVLEAPDFVHLAYRPGVDIIAGVARAGTFVHRREL